MNESNSIQAYARVTPGRDVQIYYGKKLLVIDSSIVTREPEKRPKWLTETQKVALPKDPLKDIYKNMSDGCVPTREVRGSVLKVLAAMNIDPATLDQRVMPTSVLPVDSRVHPGDYRD
jgi:hypothetical protein